MNSRSDEADADHKRNNDDQMTADYFSSSIQARQLSSQPTADDDDAAATALSATTSSIRQRPPPRRVDHTYRDYSNFPLSELSSGKKTPTNFPSKLHQILSTPEYAHVSFIFHVLYQIVPSQQQLFKTVQYLYYQYHDLTFF